MLPAMIHNLFAKLKINKAPRHRYLSEEYRRPDITAGQPRPGWRSKIKNLVPRLLPRLRKRQQQAYGGRPSRFSPPTWLIPFLLVLAVPGLFLSLGVGDRVMRALQTIAFFQVTDLEFSGNTITTNEQLREASGVLLHRTSLIGLDRAEIERRLLANPWLAAVTVRRDFPSTLKISISENLPVALLHNTGADGAGELLYIDGQGSSFLAVPPGKDIDYPVITGLMSIENPRVRQEAMAEVLLFLRRIQGNNPHLPAESVSELHVQTDGSLVIYLVEYPFPIFFGNGNTSRKYSRLIEVLKALYKKEDGRELISRVRYIDLDYMQDKVLVAQNDPG